MSVDALQEDRMLKGACYVHTLTLIYPPPDTSALVVCRMGWAVLHSKHRAHLTPLGIKRAPPWLNLIFFSDTRLKLSLLNRVVRSRDACQPHPLLYPNSIQLGQSHHHNQSLCQLTKITCQLEKGTCLTTHSCNLGCSPST